MGTIFLAGVYGVGKSTIGKKLNDLTNIPFYSASDLMVKHMVQTKQSKIKTLTKKYYQKRSRKN